MGLSLNDLGSLGMGVVSPLAGAGSAIYNNISPGSQNYLKNLIFGGQATQGLNPQGQYGAQLGGYLQNQLGPGMNFGAYDKNAANMNSLAGQMQGIASGNAPGAGEMAVNRQMGQATAAQQAAARMARGANAVLVARTAARNTADLGVNGAGLAQQAALQDQQNARGQLAALYGAMQGNELQRQNLGLNQQQGYLSGLLGLNQQQFANQAQINQLGMNDKGMLPWLLQQAATAGAKAAVG